MFRLLLLTHRQLNFKISWVHYQIKIFFLRTAQLWPSCSAGWNVVPMCHGCGFYPWSEPIQKSTNAFMDEWNNKSMVLSLFLSLLKKNQLKKQTALITYKLELSHLWYCDRVNGNACYIQLNMRLALLERKRMLMINIGMFSQ